MIFAEDDNLRDPLNEPDQAAMRSRVFWDTDGRDGRIGILVRPVLDMYDHSELVGALIGLEGLGSDPERIRTAVSSVLFADWNVDGRMVPWWDHPTPGEEKR